MTSTAAAPTFREIESGPNFEIYKGAACLQRLDWTREGNLRTTHVGNVEAWCAERIILRWDAAFRAKQRFAVFHDFADATGYESGLRVALTAWAKEHPGAQSGVHFYTRSKIVSMGVSVASLVLPGLLTNYPKRQDFDLALKKFGLPVTIAIPEFKAGT